MNQDRLKFRIPMFTDKDSFIEFQYIELGDCIESTLCGYNGNPQFCTGLKDMNDKLIYEGDVVYDPYLNENFIVKYDDNSLGFVFEASGESYGVEQFEKLLLLGNLHENPDLHIGDCEEGENGNYKKWNYI